MKKITKLGLLLTTLLSITACDVGVENGDGTNTNPDNTEDGDGSGETIERVGVVTLPTNVEHGKVAASATQGKVGDTITLEVTPDDGYEVDYVRVDGEDIKADSKGKYAFELTEGDNKVKVAFRVSIKYGNIIIESSTGKNGTIYIGKSLEVVGTELVVLLNPLPGFELDYLKLNETPITAGQDGFYKFKVVEGANKITYNFKAKAKIVPLIILDTANGSIKTAENKTEGEVGSKIEIEVIPAKDYEIDEVKFNGTNVTLNEFNKAEITLLENQNVLYATFKAVKKAATIKLVDPETAQGTLTVTPAKETYKEGEKVTVQATAKTGYLLKNIKHNNEIIGTDSEGKAIITLKAAENKLEATFIADDNAARVVLPEASTVENGKITATSTSGNINEEVTLIATANRGYEIDFIKYNGVKLEGLLTTGYETRVNINLIAGYKNVEVAFKQNAKYASLEIGTPINGTVERLDDASSFEEGDKVKLFITPKAGYLIDTITQNTKQIVTENTTGAVIEITLAKGANNIKVTFKAAPKKATVTLAKGIDNGTIKFINVPEDLKENDKITVEVVPHADFEVAGLTLNEEPVELNNANQATFAVKAGENELNAKFKAIPKGTFIFPEPTAKHGHFEVSKTSAKVGEEVTITAIPDLNYQLNEAKFNGEEIEFDSNNQAKVITKEGKNTITGSFVVIQVPGKASVIGCVNRKSINTFLATKASDTATTQFKRLDSTYKVGNDNAFTFRPKVTTFDVESSVIIENNTKWPVSLELSQFVGDKETGSYKTINPNDLSKHATYDKVAGSIKFNDNIEGLYKLTYMPEGLTKEEAKDNNLLYNFEIDVKDGYNVTKANELALLSNGANDVEGYDSKTIWDKFKTAHGLPLNTFPKGLFLQDDIQITSNDFPSEFIYTTSEVDETPQKVGKLKDSVSIYSRDLKEENDRLLIDGNYFKMDTSNIPYVAINPGDIAGGTNYSHAQLFYFTGTDKSIVPAVYDDEQHLISDKKYTSMTTISNLRMIGNAPKIDQSKAAGGLIMNKATDTNFLIDNNVSVSYFISYFPNHTKASYTIKDCTATDSYNCFVYNWGSDLIIDNTTMKGSGGPVIIQDHIHIGKGSAERQSNTQIVNSYLESYVTGEEGWFVNVDATAASATIKALDQLFNAYFHKTFLTVIPENGKKHFNMLSLNKSGDAQGMTADPRIRGSVEFTNTKTPYKFDYFESDNTLQENYLKEIASGNPVFETNAGGSCVYLNGQLVTIGDHTQLPDDKMGKGDLITLYYMGMQIIMEYKDFEVPEA